MKDKQSLLGKEAEERACQREERAAAHTPDRLISMRDYGLFRVIDYKSDEET